MEKKIEKSSKEFKEANKIINENIEQSSKESNKILCEEIKQSSKNLDKKIEQTNIDIIENVEL